MKIKTLIGKPKTFKEINDIFKLILFRTHTASLDLGWSATCSYLHGQNSKISIWDSKTGETIGYVQYKIVKPFKYELQLKGDLKELQS